MFRESGPILFLTDSFCVFFFLLLCCFFYLPLIAKCIRNIKRNTPGRSYYLVFPRDKSPASYKRSFNGLIKQWKQRNFTGKVWKQRGKKRKIRIRNISRLTSKQLWNCLVLLLGCRATYRVNSQYLHEDLSRWSPDNNPCLFLFFFSLLSHLRNFE